MKFELLFLLEGGAATEKYGTVRANRQDIKAVLSKVAEIVGVPAVELKNQLLGSTRLTYNGKQDDSGDVDLAILDKNRNEIINKMKELAGHEPRVTGGNTYSYAVETDGHRVQVDLMFVPDIAWAKFAHHASEFSKHKSGVRNELLHSALKYSMVPGQDVRVWDENGNEIARASRAYKLTSGVERIFKVAPLRKDGKGRVKAVQHAEPSEVRKALDQIGNNSTFSSDPDLIRDPDEFAKLLFGEEVKAKQMMSTEQLIKLIRKHKKKDAEKIFKDAVKGIKARNFVVPEELKQYEE